MTRKIALLGAFAVLCALAVGTVVSEPQQAAAADLGLAVGGRVSVELITSDADFSNTLSVISPAVAVAATGCTLEPSGGLGGVPILSEKISQRGCRVQLDANPAIDGIQGFADGTSIEFGMCAQTEPDDDCEFVWSSNPANNSDNFDHVATTTLSAGVFQLAWEDKENGGDGDFNDLIVVVRVEADADGDGLWDDWETSGIDTDGDSVIDYDLPALGVNPLRKDILLEIDYFDCNETGDDCVAGDNHDHQPKPAAINAVVAAFAAAPVPNPDGSTGINLIVDVDDAVPHQNFMSVGCGGNTAAFDAIKADDAYFGTANPRRYTHHYVIFGHRQSANTTSSGCGENPGNDSVVTLGEWNTICILTGPDNTLESTTTGDDISVVDTNFSAIFTGPDLTCDSTAAASDAQLVATGTQPTNDRDGDGLDDRTVGTVQQQAGTLMHEVGHNFALCHGGENDPPTFTRCNENFKPNYLSIMNYAFQTRGIAPTDPDGTGPLTARVDYSTADLPDLVETALNETTGIGDGTDQTRFFCPDGSTGTGPGSGPIDWNCDSDGGTDTNVMVDINGQNGLTTLTGWNDWINLVYAFQSTVDFEDGVHTTTQDLVEIDHVRDVERLEGVTIDVMPDSPVNPIPMRGNGVIPVAICNSDSTNHSVAIVDPSDPDGYGAASTDVLLNTIRFDSDSNGRPTHDLSDPSVLADHLTSFVDTDGDGLGDTLMPNNFSGCAGGPAGPDLIVHVRRRDAGIVAGQTEACLSAQLVSGALVLGCNPVTTG